MNRVIAFYAPIKPPDHSIPSGDREIASLMVSALNHAGFDVELASRYIAYQKRPSAELFEQRKLGALAELNRLRMAWRARPPLDRPRLWFTYHPYCKAPDWIGPEISREFEIPYVTAEACRTRQNTDADWAAGRTQVQLAVRHARCNFCLKPSDMTYLQSFLPDSETICALAPFVDVKALDQLKGNVSPPKFAGFGPTLLAAGMMRPGAKYQSYVGLAAALKQITEPEWNLIIVGDGPERTAVEQAFAGIAPDRIHWAGRLGKADLISLFRKCDIFVWPGFREAIGVVFMEAQSQGLPVAAWNSLGVPLVVENNLSGLLASENNIEDYAQALRRLIGDRALRTRMGEAARTLMVKEHDLPKAAQTFREKLLPVIDMRLPD